jgi:hypothetical protein
MNNTQCKFCTPSVFQPGDKVSKIGGDYKFDGTVVATVFKLSGVIRFVVEDDRGVLHIYSQKNLKMRQET